MSNILEVRNLSIEYATPRGKVKALRNVSLAVPRGEIVGIVGESGCGKSTLISAIIRLFPANAQVTSGEVLYEGTDLLKLDENRLRQMRGSSISMVFQDPMTSLNPVFTIGTQMADIQYRDKGRSKADKRARAAEMLKKVGIADSVQRLDQYPHEFSGGMRQRIAIAMGLLSNPGLLVADEPTTALDVTMEAQIIHLLRQLRGSFQGSILFISHNLGLIAELCDRVVVMYAGEVVEAGPVREVFHHAKHPYTKALLECDPARLPETTRLLPTIPGEIPDLIHPPAGCVFTGRCPQTFAPCPTISPVVTTHGDQHIARCHLLGHDRPA
ncbi:MAG: peptide/nickel transport system ATP-binding protein [Rhodospirillaceae bacterium]|jgi:oligopeptide/dipeptide ABC transporter ATP-binding protein|nr:peptide/nickel transport system ATP-binding protein [Rhodospirillaceae bacterium]